MSMALDDHAAALLEDLKPRLVGALKLSERNNTNTNTNYLAAAESLQVVYQHQRHSDRKNQNSLVYISIERETLMHQTTPDRDFNAHKNIESYKTFHFTHRLVFKSRYQ